MHHTMTPPPPAAISRRWRTLSRSSALLLLPLLSTLALVSQAHEWPSPAPARPYLPKQVPDAQTQAPEWAGLLWRGPRSGPPAAPDAADCNRAPQFSELPDPTPRRPQTVRHSFLPPAEGTRAEAAPRSTLAAEARAAADRPAASSGRAATLPASPAAAAPAAAETSAPAPASATAPAAAPDRLGLHSKAAPRERDGVRTSRHPADEPAPPPGPVQPAAPAHEPVTAGVVDDNADFGSYQAYARRTAHLPLRQRDTSERYLLTVHDAAGRPVADAQVTLHAAGRTQPLWARTDAGGQVWLHPRVAGITAPLLEVQVHKPGPEGELHGSALLKRGQRDQLQVRLDGSLPAQPARLDLVFLVDATGSMADEIDKLRRSMQAMADQIAQLPSRPQTCWALVAYRDRGDDYLVRAHDFTSDLAAFQQVLGGLRAGGGGDYPEAVNEALHTAVHRLSWRGDGATRLVVLVGDAPPQLGRGAPWYDDDMQAALARGIKLFAVGASGLDPSGEAVWRQLAQFTGGRFVFLTYANARNPASGPGRETLHEVNNYSVESLDKLVVRLVREELARRAG